MVQFWVQGLADTEPEEGPNEDCSVLLRVGRNRFHARLESRFWLGIIGLRGIGLKGLGLGATQRGVWGHVDATLY